MEKHEFRNILTGKKNPDYWRKDSSGQQMPYLDELTFQPVTDNGQRKAGLDAGQLQMYHTSDGPTIKVLRQQAKEGKIQLVEDRGEQEEGFVMFNTSAPPFDNLNARLAVAYALPFSAGVTLYVAASDLIPEVNRSEEKNPLVSVLVFARVALFYLLHRLIPR